MVMEKECSWKPELEKRSDKNKLYTEEQLEKAWYYGSTLSFEEALILIKQI